MLELRLYQRESVDATYAHWADGGGNGLIEIPTGGGKSLILATIARELLDLYPDMRIGCVTHVKELIAQNFQELIRVWPQAPAGIYSAGIGRRDRHARILFMGIQSVHGRAADLGGFDLLIVDEVHLIPRDSATMYGRFLAGCRALVPDMRVLGLTATPYRLDSGRLDRGKEALFQRIIYAVNVRDLIADGYLSPLLSKKTLAEIDTRGVAIRGGEFVPGSLEQAATRPAVVEAAVDEIVALGAERRGWLAFCCGVDHARQVRDAIRARGIVCETVTGDTPAAERSGIVERFKRREIRCLTSVAVLTTGFNAPHVDLIAMLRPTLSTGLYVQMVGRGFRIADGKPNCLVLDFAGNIRRHGPVDEVRPHRGEGGGDVEKVKPDTVMAKVCPECQTYVGIATMDCPACGYEWPRDLQPQHEARADAELTILSETPKKRPDDWHPVRHVTFHRHEKIGAPPSLRIECMVGVTMHRAWVCVEHDGRPRDLAGMIWRRLGGNLPVPATVEEALQRQRELRQIEAIKIRRQANSKYTEIVSWKTASDARENAA